MTRLLVGTTFIGLAIVLFDAWFSRSPERVTPTRVVVASLLGGFIVGSAIAMVAMTAPP